MSYVGAKWVLAGMVVIGLSAGSAWAAGCCAPGANSDSTKAVEAVAKPVNTHCPIMGGKIDPDNIKPELTRQFKGQTIGFCCGMCPAKWDKLSDEQKQAKLDAVMQVHE